MSTEHEAQVEAEREHFSEWMRQVNVEVLRISGVTTMDIGDYDYRSAYTSGMLPAEVAVEVLLDNDFPFECAGE